MNWNFTNYRKKEKTIGIDENEEESLLGKTRNRL